ncbi:hypothetical protein QWY22_09955 [Planococcus liqunii]|uniref:Permease n=1 Tax=Planococcus liqunii TaxID=3058394 RepID=A0ABT8MTK7_9BACL|nr:MULTISPECIES: hypothetical protein [unclassified Planococcus (in: firmicutes)]MDN7228056.1 hypothetical protein [Planococcus sp. N064]WKA52850.1 hypothetical protein QWY22_09955 [Planococcus sp. N056]
MKNKVKSFFTKYLIAIALMLLVYFLLPASNATIILIGFIPLLVWLPFDIKRLMEKRRTLKKTPQ